MKLTENQFKFVEYISQGMTQGESYKKAFSRGSVGKYEKKQGFKLASNQKIREAIQSRRDNISKQTGITAKAILEKMWDVACNVFTADAAKIQALVWLGKYKGLWGDKAGDGEGTVLNLQINNYGQVTKEELELLKRIPGERHIALPIQATIIPTPVMDSAGKRSEENSQGEPPQSR